MIILFIFRKYTFFPVRSQYESVRVQNNVLYNAELPVAPNRLTHKGLLIAPLVKTHQGNG